MTTGGDDKKLRQLEQDFNNGDPLDLIQYQSILSEVANMGFSTTDALEAALVCNTNNNIEAITDYLLDTDNNKKKRYNQKKEELSKKFDVSTEKQKLLEEVQRLNQILQQELQKQNQLKQELMERKEVTKLDKLVEFLRGIVADEIITDKELESLEQYKKENDIDEELQEEALAKLDLTSEALSELHKEVDKAGGDKCMICNDGPKEAVIWPCMHIVICHKEECWNAVKDDGSGPGAGCPSCGTAVEKVEKVYVQ